MTAAGVNNNVNIAFLIFIRLNEVVAAAQSSDALFCPKQIHMAGTAQLAQINLAYVPVRFITNRKSGWNLIINQFVELLKLNMRLSDTNCLHTASDIHAYQVRHHFVGDGHGRTDGTAGTGMNIWH